MDDVEEARHEVRRVRHDRVIRVAARCGYAAHAVLRLIIGLLAVSLAVRGSGPPTDSTGAFGLVAAVPGGVVLLAVLALGEYSLCLWLPVAGVLVRGFDLESWRRRAVHLGRAPVYGFIGTVAARFALGGHDDSVRTDRSSSRHLLDVPGGPLVLGAIGVLVLVVGLSLVWLGVSRRFRVTLELPHGVLARRTVLTVGVVGYVARGVSVVSTGVLVVVAAVSSDPASADGLAGGLGGFVGTPVGRAVLAVLGVGWLVAAVQAVIRARIGRIDR